MKIQKNKPVSSTKTRCGIALLAAAALPFVAYADGPAYFLIGAGGAGGAPGGSAGGGGGGIGGGGGQYINTGGSGAIGATGGNGVSGGLGAPSYMISSADAPAVLANAISTNAAGIGGGGGGGGGGSAGGEGSAGYLVISDTGSLTTIAASLLVGGSGGGGSTAGMSGGAGGFGRLILSGDAIIGTTLQIGGAGGTSGGIGGGGGGAGGNGEIHVLGGDLAAASIALGGVVGNGNGGAGGTGYLFATSGTITATNITVGSQTGAIGGLIIGGTAAIHATNAVLVRANGVVNIGYADNAPSTAGTFDAPSINLTDSTASLIFRQTDTTTYAGDITGSGRLLHYASGKTILTGSNSFAAGITLGDPILPSGKLELGSANAIGGSSAANGTIIFEGGILGFSSSNNTDYSARFSTSANQRFAFDTNGRTVTLATTLTSVGGTLKKLGGGTLVLTADSLYDGGTTIAGGELRIGSGGTSGSISGNVVNNGILNFFRSDNITFAGVISGSGSVAKSGGKLTLAGDNTYTGGTTIGDGTLQIGDGGTSGLIAGPVLNNGTLIFNRSDDIALAGNVYGAGVLQKHGAGMLTMTGDITLAGATSVYAGTLRIGDGGGAGSISGDIALWQGSIIFDRTGDSIYAGTLDSVSNIATLTKRGSGKLTLTGPHVHTAGIIIAAGTLEVGDGGTTGEILGPVTNEGTLVFNRADSVVFSDAITGSGSLVHLGTGSLTLTGANTFTGDTTIASGILRLGDGNGGTTGSLVGNIRDNGTLVYARPDDLVLPGAITGTGGVQKLGAGTLTLAGDNTYTGGTTVYGGTLRIGAGGTTGTLAGHVVLNGSLLFDRLGDSIFAGDVSGAGNIGYQGNATLVLSGNHAAHTGLTTALAGTIIVDSGSVSGGDYYTATNDARIIFSGHDGTLANDLSGSGTYSFRGAGTTVLGGRKTGTGELAVSGGHTLDIGGTAASPTALAFSQVNVLAGGTLTGSGAFGSLVNDGGTVSPGHSPGTLVLAGDFVSTRGALNIEIAGTGAGRFDRILYAGHAVVNGTALNVSLLGGFTPVGGDTFLFLEDTAPDGTLSMQGFGFSSVNLPTLPGAIGARLVNSAAGVTLEYYRATSAGLPGYAPHDGLDSFAAAMPYNGPAFDAILATGGGINTALTNASPLGFTAADALVLEENRLSSDGLRERAQADALTPTGDWRVFIDTRNALTTWESGRDQGTFDQQVYGGKAGLSKRLDSGLSVGLTLGYDSGTATFHDAGGRIGQDRGSVAGYMAYSFDHAGYAYVGVSGGFSSFDTRRDTVLGRLKGDTDGHDISTTAGYGARLDLGADFDMSPYVALTYTSVTTEGFSEADTNALASAFSKRNSDSLRFKLGSDIGWRVPAGSGSLRFALGAAYEVEAMDAHADIRGRFLNGSGDYTATGNTLSRHSLSFGPSVSYEFTPEQTVSAGYSYESGFSGTGSNRFSVVYTARF